MRGREVKVPDGYKGIVVKEGDLEEARQMSETGILHEVANFEDMVVWGHETCIEPEDVFVKALDEWVKVATSVSTEFRSINKFV